MTFYLICAKPKKDPVTQVELYNWCPVGDECIAWTTNRTIVKMFIEEYNKYTDISINRVECSSVNEFIEIARVEYSSDVNPFNELYAYYSDMDTSKFHVTTQSIGDSNDSDGITDVQFQSALQSITRSSLNMLKLAKYINQPDVVNSLRYIIFRYLSQVVLYNEGFCLDDINDNLREPFGVTSESDIEDGMFSVVDQVLFEKFCMGLEI